MRAYVLGCMAWGVSAPGVFTWLDGIMSVLQLFRKFSKFWLNMRNFLQLFVFIGLYGTKSVLQLFWVFSLGCMAWGVFCNYFGSFHWAVWHEECFATGSGEVMRMITSRTSTFGAFISPIASIFCFCASLHWASSKGSAIVKRLCSLERLTIRYNPIKALEQTTRIRVYMVPHTRFNRLTPVKLEICPKFPFKFT